MIKFFFLLLASSVSCFSLKYTDLELFWQKDEEKYKFLNINPKNNEIFANNWTYFIEIYKYSNGYYKFSDIVSIKNKEIKLLSFHPDGKDIICVTKDDEILFLNENLEIKKMYSFNFGEIFDLSFSPKGNYILLKCENSLIILCYNKNLKIEPILKKEIIPFGWDRNENFAYYEENKLRILDLKNNRIEDLFETDDLKAISFDLNNNPVFGNSNGEILKYDGLNKEIKIIYKLYDKPINGIGFNSKGNLIIITNGTNLLNIFSYPKFKIYNQNPFSDVITDFSILKNDILILKFFKGYKMLYDLEKKQTIYVPRSKPIIYGDICKKYNAIYAIQYLQETTYTYKIDISTGKVLNFSKLKGVQADFISITPDENFLILFFSEGFMVFEIKKEGSKLKKEVFIYNTANPKIFYRDDGKEAFVLLQNNSFIIFKIPEFSGVTGKIESALQYNPSENNFIPLGWFNDKFYGFYYYTSLKRMYLLKIDDKLNIEKKEIDKEINWIKIYFYEEEGKNIFLKAYIKGEKNIEKYGIFSLEDEKFKFREEFKPVVGFIEPKARASNAPAVFLPKTLFFQSAKGRFDFESYAEKISKPKVKAVELIPKISDYCGTGLMDIGSSDLIKFKENLAFVFKDNILVYKLKEKEIEEKIKFGGIKNFKVSSYISGILEFEENEFADYFKGNIAICYSKNEGECKKNFIVKKRIPIGGKNILASVPIEDVSGKYVLGKWEIFKNFFIGEDREVYIENQNNKVNFVLENRNITKKYWYKHNYKLCRQSSLVDWISSGGNFIVTRCRDEAGYNFYKFEDGEMPYFFAIKDISSYYIQPTILEDGSGFYYFDYLSKDKKNIPIFKVISLPDMNLIFEKLLPENCYIKKVSQNGKFFIYLASNEPINIIDIKNGKKNFKIEFPWFKIRGIEVSPCNDKVAIFELGTLYIYNINGELDFKIDFDFIGKDPYFNSFVPPIENYQEYSGFDVHLISFSPNCEKIAAIIREKLVIFDLINKKIERVYEGIKDISKIFWNPKSSAVFLLNFHERTFASYYFYHIDLNLYHSISFSGYPLKWISDSEFMTINGVYEFKEPPILILF